MRAILSLGMTVGIGLALGTRAAPAPGVDALGDIVGAWQSDTTNGMSALSICTWTPQHGAVLCEQTITTPGGARHALSLFTFEAGAGKFVFYTLGQPGDAMRPVPLAIDRHIWIYGGQTKDANGAFSRTVNDFTAKDSYTWRLESSTDGERWTPGVHGMSRRVR
jgi:hypothetical protein